MSYTIPLMTVPVPTSDELNLDQYCSLGTSFDALLRERQTLKQLIEEAEVRIAELDEQSGPVLDLAGVKNVTWNGYLVSRREASKPRRTLDAGKLVAAGVDPIQIEAGYRYGKAGKVGITVRRLSQTPEAETAGEFVS